MMTLRLYTVSCMWCTVYNRQVQVQAQVQAQVQVRVLLPDCTCCADGARMSRNGRHGAAVSLSI